MPTPKELASQIDRIVAHLVEIGLATDQNYAIYRSLQKGQSEVTFQGANYLAATLKNNTYLEIYKILKTERVYTVCMLDGAFLQLTYFFRGEQLERHRLAFFPSPYLENFQADPEGYLEDSVYADIVARNIVPFPLRFDFDCREDVFQELHHPKSHLTLGQYENCRIPVTAPLVPAHFVDFILRHFYDTKHSRYTKDLPRSNSLFSESIFQVERSIIHLQIPV